MKKRKSFKGFECAGFVLLDGTKFEEPLADPLSLPSRLICGMEIWECVRRIFDHGLAVAGLYAHENYHWAISVGLRGCGNEWEGFWVVTERAERLHGYPCRTFGEALAFTRQGHRFHRN